MFGMGKRVDATQISSEIEDGKALLVDVRGDDEWNIGHAKGAMHLSVDRILAGHLPSTKKEKKLYLYCASGGRAGTAANYLKEKGFQAENIGGLSNWRSAGGQVE